MSDIVSLSPDAVKALGTSDASSTGTTAQGGSQTPGKLSDLYQALANIINSKTTTDGQKLEAYKAYSLDSTIRDTTLDHLQFQASADDTNFWNARQGSSINQGEAAIREGRSDGSALAKGIAAVDNENAQLATQNLNGVFTSLSSSISVSVSSSGSVSVASSVTKAFKPADQLSAEALLFSGLTADSAGATVDAPSPLETTVPSAKQSKDESALLLLEADAKSRQSPVAATLTPSGGHRPSSGVTASPVG